MNLADRTGADDTSADLAVLLDEGYQVTFTKIMPGYMVTLTGPSGSQAEGTGGTPGDALRSAWPPGDDDEDEGEDDSEPYCMTCGGNLGIFPGYGQDWHHWRGDGTAGSPVELIAAGHAPVAAWRPAGAR